MTRVTVEHDSALISPVRTFLQALGLVGLLAMAAGCSCQNLATDPPPEEPTAAKSVSCSCKVTGSGPFGIGAQEFTVSETFCVPDAFNTDVPGSTPEDFCTSSEFANFLSAAGLSVAESQDSAACDFVSVSVSECAAVPRSGATPEAQAPVQFAEECGGTCQSIPCNSTNCSLENLQGGECECTVPAPCGQFGNAAVCTPSFAGGILPPESDPQSAGPLDLGVGAGSMRSYVSMPGGWAAGSSMTTSVNFDACFLIFCSHIEDEATSEVGGTFEVFGTPCPGGACSAGFHTRAQVAPFQLVLDGPHDITEMNIEIISTSTALTVGADGTGTIPAQALLMNAFARDNGAPKVIHDQLNPVDVPFVIDWSTRTLNIPSLQVPFPGNEGTVTIQLVGSFGLSPTESFDVPEAPEEPEEPEEPEVPDTDGDGIDDEQDNCPLVPNADQAPVDSPVLTVGAAITGCSAPTLATPGAEDVCFGEPVVVTNDAPAVLPLGESAAIWTATDSKGGTADGEQVVYITPTLTAATVITLSDRAKVLTGSVAAVGTGASVLRNDSVLTWFGSNGPITVKDRVTVGSALVSAGAITLGSGGTYPPGGILPWTLPTFGVFPELAALSFSIGSTSVTLQPDKVGSLNPGSYASVVLYSRSTMTLGPGDYYFKSLQLEPDSKLIITGGTKIFVRDAVTMRGSVLTGQHPLSIFYNGTPDVVLERNFTGRFIAPRAKVYLGAGSQLTFVGGISAKSIEVRPDVQLTCRAY
jgi:hypothetical protein